MGIRTGDLAWDHNYWPIEVSRELVHHPTWMSEPCLPAFPLNDFMLKIPQGSGKRADFLSFNFTRTKEPTVQFPCEDQNIQAVRNQSPENFPNYQSKILPFSNSMPCCNFSSKHGFICRTAVSLNVVFHLAECLADITSEHDTPPTCYGKEQ